MNTPREFYSDIHVIRRMLEYCGVPSDRTKDFHPHPRDFTVFRSRALSEITAAMTTEYISGWGEYLEHKKGKKWSSRKNHCLGELLEGEVNLFRSLWDKQSIIFLLDIEYVSKKYPGEPYLHQEATFHKLEPVYRCVWDIFDKFGIEVITLATGQGYHFVFSVNSYDRPYTDPERKVTPLTQELVSIGHLESTLRGKYEHLIPGKRRNRIVTADLGRAFDASGKLLEYIVHKVIRRAAEYGCNVPLSIGDIAAGNPMQETINLDLSTYVSPLYSRVTRLPFSIHSKHKDKKKDIGAGHIPIQITLPRFTPELGDSLSLPNLFQFRRHFRHAAEYAAGTTTSIPESSRGVNELINAYRQSSLYQFHLEFDRTAGDEPRDWPLTYDRFDLRTLPPCVAKTLEYPNPSLLQPSQLQTIVRILTGKRWWHPKHVAGLIRSKYERDQGWEYNWHTHDAYTHAANWVRFYAGLLATGTDQRTDQNCISHQEKGMCVQPFCGYNLGSYR